jgi:YVTN family beta-propeller protein
MIALGRLLRCGCLMLAFASLPTYASTARVYVTNSAGDSIHVVDTATNKVVQAIKGIEAAHGINFAPDGSRVYVSNESTSTLDVFDRESGRLIKKVELTAHPNNIAVRTLDRDNVIITHDPSEGLSGHRAAHQ